MVGTEEAIEILEHATENRIVNIQLLPAGFVHGYLLNDVVPRRTYRVIVDPRWRSMRVWMTSVAKAQNQNKAVSKAVQRSRRAFTRGLVGIDPTGAVSFRYENDTDLTSPQLALLLNKMIASIEQFEMTVTFYTMLDSHIPRNRVREVMNSKFPKWKDRATR